MAQIKWLGEDELHGSGAGPSFTTAFGGIKFPKGENVEIRSHAFVQKALNNQFFEVSDPEDVDDAPQVEKKNKGGRPRKEKQVGPTVTEWVEAGYLASNYPPDGFEPNSSPEEIAAAVEKEKASA